MAKKKKMGAKKQIGNRRFFSAKWIFLFIVLIPVFSFLHLFDIGNLSKMLVMEEPAKRPAVKPEKVFPPKKKQVLPEKEKALPGTDSLPQQGGVKGYVAIIIDDVGFNKKVVSGFIKLDIPLTFSVLPGQRYSVELAESITKAGYEVMLHIPMEPKSDAYKKSGMEVLKLSHSKEELREIVRRQLAELPNIVGANNHMGSLFTENSAGMSIVLDEIDNAGLFFLDSLTTPKSVGMKLARSKGIKAVARDMFLDHEIEHDKIAAEVKEAIRIAAKRGYSVAIGHPHKETLNVLGEMKGEFGKAGVEPVFVSKLVR